MVDVMRLRQDENLATKQRILDQLNKEGQMDKMKANLRQEVLRVLENEKKKSFGGASKYLKQSELANTVTKKVVSNDDGLLCAEIIREFLQFYQMEHSLHVFVPEMALGGPEFAKTKTEIEREANIQDKDQSKPLLLRIIEQCKFGPVGGGPGVGGGFPSASNLHQTSLSEQPSPPVGSKYSPEQQVQHLNQQSQFAGLNKHSPDPTNKLEGNSLNNLQSPDPSSKKENVRKSKKESKPAPPAKAPVNSNNNVSGGGSSLLGDLPGFNDKSRVSGGGLMNQNSAAFDDFDFEDADASPSMEKGAPKPKNAKSGQSKASKIKDKYSAAQAALDDFDQEERDGFKISNQPSGQNNANSSSNSNNRFRVNVYGIPHAQAEENTQHEDDDDDAIEEDFIEEEIQTDRDLLQVPEPVHAITGSQSFGVDPSVDSLALDDFDHVELVE